VVDYRGSTWQAIQRTIGDNPTTSPAYWKLLSDNMVYKFRGTFQAGTTYYWSDEVRDVVEYPANSGNFYRYNTYTGDSGNTPAGWVSSAWELYGASFDMVATDTLLADGAYIADFVIQNGRITAQNSAMRIYGPQGTIIWDTTSVNGGAANTRLAADGFLISANGVFADQPTTAYDSNGNPITTISTGVKAAVIGKVDGSGSFLVPKAGVYGESENQGPYDFGGYFVRAFVDQFFEVNGVTKLESVRMGARRGGTTTLGNSDYWYTATSSATVYLPSTRVVGMVYFVKKATTSTVTINAGSATIYWKGTVGSTENIRSTGMTVMLVWDGAYWQYAELFQ